MAKTILVVDDFEDTLEMLKVLLEKLGYEVHLARDGWKAVESVKRQVPDLILMDMALPQVNGIAATKLIRQLNEASDIPIIAFTASGKFIYRQAIDAGCNDLIEKPVDIQKLKLILKKYLKK
jgi:two-component system, cell cycle response regulator DivK